MFVRLRRAYGGMNEDYYVGLTGDVDRRIGEHNAGKSDSTYKFRPWKCEVKIWFDDSVKAERFEAYLKSGSGRTFSKRHF